jgi:hypothetical protein
MVVPLTMFATTMPVWQGRGDRPGRDLVAVMVPAAICAAVTAPAASGGVVIAPAARAWVPNW